MTLTLESPLVSIPLHGLPIAAAAIDRNGIIVASNRRFERLCGRVDTTRSPQHLADAVAEPYRAAVTDAFETLSAFDSQATQGWSIKALRAKPPCLWLAIDLVPLGPDAAVPCLACARAVAHRRRDDVLPLPRRASGAVGTQASAAMLRPRIKRWSPVLMTLSHEFRGPLTAIRGWAQMAARGELPPAKMSRALTVIGRNAATLSEMVENLFDLSRQATGSLALKRDVIDLNPLARLVVESAQPAAKGHGIVLAGHAPTVPLLVYGDPVRLEQVIRNLVENAIKFTPPGGHVRVHTTRDTSFAELVVTDDGCGISRDLLPVIFEPFKHEHSTVQASEKGLGLGLALVRELVQLHGGDVRAVSKGEGQGSTFIVRLPTINAAAAAHINSTGGEQRCHTPEQSSIGQEGLCQRRRITTRTSGKRYPERQ